MVPWVYGLAWGIGDFVFLGAFFIVVIIIGATLLLSLRRTVQTIRSDRSGSVRWELEFHDFPQAARVCRHVFTGEFEQRSCQNGFDCRSCATHANLLANTAVTQGDSVVPAEAFGFSIPADRLYHRGHTWVRQDEPGIYTVGLDDFAARLVGTATGIELPQPGTQLQVNGSGWKIEKGDTRVRILSPLDGVVVATSDGSEGWYLKVKTTAQEVDTRYLLCAREVGAWFLEEFERLQRKLADPKVGLTFADGGTPVKDFTKAYPDKNWQAIYSEMLLES